MSIQLNEIKSTEWGLDIENQGEVKQGLDDIKQCVYIILMTQKLTDPLREDFGCGAFDYVDMPVNKAIPNIIKSASSIALITSLVGLTSFLYSI